MIEKHIVELLIEANKKLSAVIDKVESDNQSSQHHQMVIDEANSVIRQLDHIVEKLEETT